jgi:CBS domain-containing protein
VGDVMTRDVITTRLATTLHPALSTMHSRGIRRLPVVSGDGPPEGLLAFDDILEVMSEELSELVGLVAREQKLERELHKQCSSASQPFWRRRDGYQYDGYCR